MAFVEEKLSTEQKIQNIISDFVVKNKKLILIGCAVVVALVLAIVICITSVSSSREKALIKVEAYQDAYEMLDVSSETYSHDFADLIHGCRKLVKGKRYPSVKAQYLIGLAYYQNDNYDIAYDAFMKAYNLNKDIHLAELSLFNAAASLESMGDSDKALSLYEQVAADYANKETGVVPRALFSAARIYLEKGNSSLANTTLQQLVSSYPDSEYAKLAKNILSVH